jgi:uncharacterized protein
VKCFYHKVDHDGQASAFLVKQIYPETELIGINYGDKFPEDSIAPEESVFMVDFTLQPFSEMIRIAKMIREKSGEFYWIDHHISSISAYHLALSKNETDEIKGAQSVTDAACALTWGYLHGVEECPRFIRLLADYDIWKHDRNENILPFHYGLRSQATPPENVELWKTFFDDKVIDNICMQGRIVLDYIKTENRQYARGTAFETKIDGCNAIAINRMMANSKIFESIKNVEKYEVQILFGWQKVRWRCQLFSIGGQVDVSRIAVKYGGGGHAGAAGFQIEKLPFELGVKS